MRQLIRRRAISPDILHFPEFPSVRLQWPANRAAILIPDRVLPVYFVRHAVPVLAASPPDARARGVPVVAAAVSAPWSRGPRRLTGRSRTTPIGWLQRVSGAR